MMTRSRSVHFAPLLLMLALPAAPALAQSASEYEDWLAWCESVGTARDSEPDRQL